MNRASHLGISPSDADFHGRADATRCQAVFLPWTHIRHTSVTYRVAVRGLVAAGAALAAVGLTATACGGASGPASLRLDSVPFRPELALTPAQQRRGLMFRKTAPADGMLFVFPRATSGGFWMKNTLVPLRIVFFDTAGRSVRRLEMTPCRTDPCRLYRPGRRYRYALELGANDERSARRLGPMSELERLVRLAG